MSRLLDSQKKGTLYITNSYENEIKIQDEKISILPERLGERALDITNNQNKMTYDMLENHYSYETGQDKMTLDLSKNYEERIIRIIIDDKVESGDKYLLNLPGNNACPPSGKINNHN